MNETDPKYLKDIILSFIIAGKDTTASTLSWFLYMMCKHRLIQEKIVKEVMAATKLKEDSRIDEVANSITEAALDKMQLLHAALSETLRLYPAVPSVISYLFVEDPINIHNKKLVECKEVSLSIFIYCLPPGWEDVFFGRYFPRWIQHQERAFGGICTILNGQDEIFMG